MMINTGHKLKSLSKGNYSENHGDSAEGFYKRGGKRGIYEAGKALQNYPARLALRITRMETQKYKLQCGRNQRLIIMWT